MSSILNTARGFNRRSFLRTAAATAGAAVLGDALAACGGGSPSSSTTTVQYWDWWVSQAPWVDKEVSLFQQAHPNIKLKKTTQGNNTYANLFSLSVKSKNAPDVFMIPQTPPLNDQVAQNWLLPLDKWATAEWKSNFPEGTFHEGNNVFNSKLYSAPFSGTAPWVQLYIHNAVFKQYGLTNSDGTIKLPQTWDDVTQFAETITKKSGGQVYGLGFGNGSFNLIPWWMQVFVQGSGAVGGAYNIDNRTGQYTYGTDPNYLNFVQLLLEWKSKGYFYPNSMSITDETARAYFERGKFGMTVGGVWNQAEWTTHQFTDYSLATLISPEATPKSYFYTTPGGTMLAVSAQTKHPDEAWAWFDWFYSKDAGKRWVQMGEDLSIFPDNNDPKQVKFAPFAQYVNTSKLAIPGPDPSVRNPLTSQVIVNPVKPDIGDVLAGLYTGQIKDVKGTLSDLANRMQKAQQAGIDAAKQKGANVSLDDYIFADWDITKPYITKPKSS